MTEIAQEDKDTIDKFFDKLEQAFTTGGEVTLTKIGDCVSKMPIGDLQHLGGLVKKYGYFGAFSAIQQSLEQKDLGPIGKYALATGIAVVTIPASYGILSTTLIALAIGGLVDLSWDYIEEHQEDIFEELKSLLAAVGLKFDENNNLLVDLNLFNNHSSLLSPKDTMCLIQDLISTAEETRSPLIVDLDGDGVETTTVAGGVHFDHDGNGFAEKTAWAGKDDGLLVRDVNGNGQIDDGTELFGNNSVLSNGQKAANGFEALKDLDSNNDGIFNNLDSAWNEVKVWKDGNQNGIVDENELLTLEQAGISGIDLNYNSQDIEDANGNEHKQNGTFIKTDGTTGNITDVWFDTDQADTIDTADVSLPEDIQVLPEIAGFGNVHSLRTAMALDVSGELKSLVQQFVAADSISARKATNDNFLFPSSARKKCISA